MAKIKTYRIEAVSDNGYQVVVQAGNRVLYVDQPSFAGGTDTGASPMEYLFSSVAGCVVTTARIMAHQKKIHLKRVEVKVDGSLDLDVIYGKNSADRPGLSGLNIHLALETDMPEKERQNFLEELRSRCPVYDSILHATPTEFSV